MVEVSEFSPTSEASRGENDSDVLLMNFLRKLTFSFAGAKRSERTENQRFSRLTLWTISISA
jgi:hypothetical protein